MSTAIYFVCLTLMLPIAGFAAFGFLIDSLVTRGLWEAFKTIFAPLFDPFGRGRWFFLFFFGFLALCAAGFFPESQPYGFGALACIGAGCTVYVLRVYPNWEAGAIPLFLPSIVGIGLSVYSLVRPIQ
jgi:hypothetical protein